MRGVIAAAVLLLAPAIAAAQDRIVLRNTKILTGKVVAIGLDGVQMEGTRDPVGWDEIESGRLSENQARFDELLKQVGEPLYRIRRRLQAGDFRDLLEPAEEVYPRFAGQRSSTAYMVCQALTWARLARGQRESALEPYLSGLASLKKLNLLTATQVPQLGARRLQVDPQTGLTPDLPPVWFDADAAKAAWPGVRDLIKSAGSDLPGGALVYGATLALSAGDTAAADQLLRDVPKAPKALADLVTVVQAQKEILAGRPAPAEAELQRQLNELSDSVRPLAHYWLGQAALASEEEEKKKEGIVQLLHLPALYGEQYPNLAGAALYQSARVLEASPDSATHAIGIGRLRTELLTRYAQTYHGQRLKAELEARSKKPDEKTN